MQTANTLMGLVGILINGVAIVSYIVFWVMSLYGAITRKDLKNSKALWIVLIIFTGGLGSLIYFFVENRKKQGKLFLLLSLVLPLVLIIASLFLTSTSR